MSTDIIKIEPRELATTERGSRPPAIVEDAGKPAMFAYAEFFEAELENDNTHVALPLRGEPVPRVVREPGL